MSRQLVVTELKPKNTPDISKSLQAQGYTIVRGYYREEGEEDEKPELLYVSPKMLEAAEIQDKKPKKPK
jgi:hypothetical protein